MQGSVEDLVTILLFARDRPHYLPATLASVAIQTEQRWRLIVSDNSSQPESARRNAELVEAFRREHPQRAVTYVRRNGNLSVMEHFLAGIAEVETPLLAVHNDDDIWMAHHLEQAVQWLVAAPDRGMTASEALIIDPEGKLTGRFLNRVLAPRETAWERWLAIWLSSSPSHYGNWPGMVARTDIARQLPRIDNKLTDALLVVWFALKGYRIKGFDVPSYYYRVHKLTVTKTGTPLLVEKHRLILWLARHYFLPLTRLYRNFPLLVLKSTLALKLKYRRALA